MIYSKINGEVIVPVVIKVLPFWWWLVDILGCLVDELMMVQQPRTTAHWQAPSLFVASDSGIVCSICNSVSYGSSNGGICASNTHLFLTGVSLIQYYTVASMLYT